MVLKRVTFSGRFLSPEQERVETWKIVLRSLVLALLDIFIVLSVAISIFYMFAGYMVVPHEKGFFCNDTTITKPFLPNTVTTSHLLLVSLASPLLGIAIFEALLFRNARGSNLLAKFFRSTTVEYLEYLLAYTVCTILMETFKCFFGRLRPHFLSACQPDWTKMDCKTDPEAYISEIACLATPHRVRVSRTSFPSGHTAAACFILFYFFFHVNRLVNASGSPTIRRARTMLMVPLTIWTIFVMVTRVTDCWHHPTDVLGGVVLALVCIATPFGFRSTSHVFEKREIEKAIKVE